MKTIIRILLIPLLMIQTTYGAVTVEGSADDFCATTCYDGSNQRTIAINIGTRTNGLLVVGIDTREGAPGQPETRITAMTYNGVSMSLSTEANIPSTSTRDQYASIWYLANPTDGNNNLVITADSNLGAIYTVAAWMDGADQTQATVLDDTCWYNSFTSPYACTLNPTADNTVLVSMYSSGASNLFTVGSGEFILRENDHGAYIGGSSTATQTTATSQSMDWSGDDAGTSLVAANFKETGGAPPAETPESRQPSRVIIIQ